MPDAVALRDPLAVADDAEPGRLVEAKARLVGGDDRGLDRPDAVCRCVGEQSQEEGSPDASSSHPRIDVHRVLDDAAVARAG